MSFLWRFGARTGNNDEAASSDGPGSSPPSTPQLDSRVDTSPRTPNPFRTRNNGMIRYIIQGETFSIHPVELVPFTRVWEMRVAPMPSITNQAFADLLNAAGFDNDMAAGVWDRAFTATRLNSDANESSVADDSIGRHDFYIFLAELQRASQLTHREIFLKMTSNGSMPTTPAVMSNPFVKRASTHIQSHTEAEATSEDEVECAASGIGSSSDNVNTTVADGHSEYLQAMGHPVDPGVVYRVKEDISTTTPQPRKSVQEYDTAQEKQVCWAENAPLPEVSSGASLVSLNLQGLHLQSLGDAPERVQASAPGSEVTATGHIHPPQSASVLGMHPTQRENLPEAVPNQQTHPPVLQQIPKSQAHTKASSSATERPKDNSSPANEDKKVTAASPLELNAPIETWQSLEKAKTILDSKRKTVSRFFNSDKEASYLALVEAAAGGFLPVVASLLSLGAQVNYVPSDRLPWCALDAAARQGHGQVAALLARRADQATINFAFVVACAAGHVEISRLLLNDYKAQIRDITYRKPRFIDQAVFNNMPASGTNVFDYMACMSTKRCLQLLDDILAHGNFVLNQKYRSGKNALGIFVSAGRLNATDRLLKRGAAVNGSVHALDCLDWMSGQKEAAILLETLLSAGAKPSSPQALSETVANAVRARDTKSISRLVNAFEVDFGIQASGKRANITKEDHKCTPLGWASSSGKLNIVELLVNAGAPPYQKAGSIGVPLHYAIANGSEDIVAYFLKKNPELATPVALRKAITGGQISIVQMLLDAGAPSTIRVWLGAMQSNRSAEKKHEGYRLCIRMLTNLPCTIDCSVVRMAIDNDNYHGLAVLLEQLPAEDARVLVYKLCPAYERKTKVVKVVNERAIDYAKRVKKPHFVPLLQKHGGQPFDGHAGWDLDNCPHKITIGAKRS